MYKMNRIALVVGVTGMTGSNLAKELVMQGWKTYGISKNSSNIIPNVISLKADLLDKESLESALSQVHPTHVFYTSWMRMSSEKENIMVNGAMVTNLLDVVSSKKSVQHVALVTGLKHYLGPFEAYATNGNLPETPVREDHPRLAYDNFYYAQEDEVFNAAKRDGFTWSIHRPHTLIGNAVGNLMNLGTTLAVYATLCKHEGVPFTFPGSKAQWDGLSDVTDVEVLAKHLIWTSTTAGAFNQAFNIVNGDVFRWSWMWKQIAQWFEIEYVGYHQDSSSLEEIIHDKGKLWEEIAIQHKLVETDLCKVSSPWHTDADLSRPIEVITDMTKSRLMGFKEYKSTKQSFFDLFVQLRESNIIP